MTGNPEVERRIGPEKRPSRQCAISWRQADLSLPIQPQRVHWRFTTHRV